MVVPERESTEQLLYDARDAIHPELPYGRSALRLDNSSGNVASSLSSIADEHQSINALPKVISRPDEHIVDNRQRGVPCYDTVGCTVPILQCVSPIVIARCTSHMLVAV